MKKVWQLYEDLCTKDLQVHYPAQYVKHLGQLLWTNTAYHGHGYVEAFQI